VWSECVVRQQFPKHFGAQPFLLVERSIHVKDDNLFVSDVCELKLHVGLSKRTATSVFGKLCVNRNKIQFLQKAVLTEFAPSHGLGKWGAKPVGLTPFADRFVGSLRRWI